MNAPSSNGGITEVELLQFFQAIEQEAVSLHPVNDPQDTYAGHVSYTASNGWSITIFNDCNEWDYVESVTTPDGRSVNFDAIDDHMPIARQYAPTDDVAWSRYGIPGYCTFRCTACSAVLIDHALRQPPFRCVACSGQYVEPKNID